MPAQDQFSRCIETIKPLLVKYNNDYCNVVYNGQCSINGAYQPSVAEPNERRFIGKGLYIRVYIKYTSVCMLILYYSTCTYTLYMLLYYL